MWLVSVAVGGGLVCLYVAGRYNMQAVTEDLNDFFSARVAQAVGALREQVEMDAMLVDHAYSSSEQARHESNPQEAIRMLELAFSHVARAVPNRILRLKALGVCCRVAAGIQEVPPLKPAGFRLAQLKTVVGLAGVAHHFLVSGYERLLLRLGLLRFGFRLVLRVMERAKTGASAAPEAALPWRSFDAARTDFKALDGQYVETSRVALLSLALRDSLAAPARAVPSGN
jgi:hypothetical protein